jgi:Domain of unknown function (DUF4371)/OTU-like cysteine protease/hAT family C-terminal dimerisation region
MYLYLPDQARVPASASASVSDRNPDSDSDMLKMSHIADRLNFAIEDVPHDGNCMFSAIAYQLGRYGEAAAVRAEIANYMQMNVEVLEESNVASDIKSYISKMSENGTWGDGTVLCMAAKLYSRQLIVYTDNQVEGNPINFLTENDKVCAAAEPIRLCYVSTSAGTENNHYASLVKKELVEARVKNDSQLASDDNGSANAQANANDNKEKDENDNDLSDSDSVSVSDTVSSCQSQKPMCMCSNIALDRPTDCTSTSSTSTNTPARRTRKVTTQSQAKGRQSQAKRRSYRSQWSATFPWINYDAQQDHITCAVCVKYQAMDKNKAGHLADSFIKGFRNWKRATEKLKIHEESCSHRHALSTVQFRESGTDVANMLDKRVRELQVSSRAALKSIIECLLYLAYQGMPLRGKTDKTSNFNNLLNLIQKYCVDLANHLKRKRSYVSHDMQNEILQLSANQVLREIVKEAKASGPLGLLVDGCQEGTSEQICVCIRYCTTDLTVHEKVLGLYATSNTDAETLTNVILDVFLRLDLPVERIVGQAYDGASSMSGCISGVQARVRDKAPMASYVHCNAHCLDLVLQEVGKSVPLVRDAISLVHEIGTFLNASPLRRANYKEVQRKMVEEKRILADETVEPDDIARNVSVDTDSNEIEMKEGNVQKSAMNGVRKLSMTRWLARTPALQDVLRGYDALQVAFEEFSNSTGTTQSNSSCRGIAVLLGKAVTYIGIYISLLIFRKAELVSRTLQQRGILLKTSIDSVRELQEFYSKQRTDAAWNQIWESCMQKAEELDLEKPSLPRVRRPPKKLEHAPNVAVPHRFESIKEKYKIQFFELIDKLVNELDRRFNQPGMSNLLAIERVLTGAGKCDDVDKLISTYSAFMKSKSSLIRQLDSVADLCLEHKVSQTLPNVICQMQVIVQKGLHVLFHDVLMLLSIYMASPITSVECERSFSALRRLKYWLRSTTGQPRLNHELILLLNPEHSIDIDSVIHDFVLLNQQRQSDFGVGL